MKTVTLKLTDAELKALDTGNQKGCLVELNKQGSFWMLNVFDVDEFREFLNDEMDMEWLKVDKFGKGVDFIPIKYRNTFNIIRSIKQKLTNLEVK